MLQQNLSDHDITHIKGQVSCYTHAISHPFFFFKFPDPMLIIDRKPYIPISQTLSSDDCILSSHGVSTEYATNKWLK